MPIRFILSDENIGIYMNGSKTVAGRLAALNSQIRTKLQMLILGDLEISRSLFTRFSGPSRFSVLHERQIFGIDNVIAAQLFGREAFSLNQSPHTIRAHAKTLSSFGSPD